MKKKKSTQLNQILSIPANNDVPICQLEFRNAFEIEEGGTQNADSFFQFGIN